MYKCLSLAAIAAVSLPEADAAMNPYKEAWLTQQGIDVEALHGSAAWAMSKGEKYTHRVKGQALKKRQEFQEVKRRYAIDWIKD